MSHMQPGLGRLACSAGLPRLPVLTKRHGKTLPLVSEFLTTEEAEAYDKWFRAQVQASLEDPRPSVPHDQAMVRLRATIEAAKPRKKRA
jgi:hypothetical protein